MIRSCKIIKVPFAESLIKSLKDNQYQKLNTFNPMPERKNIKLIQLIDKDTGKTEPYIMELNLVGKGYYGSVYKAVHQHNPNMVFAVKVVNLQREETKEEILRQLEIIQNIPKSPNLVDTHKQHLESARHLYIFQEYCEGGSLAEYKERTHGRLMREEQAFDLFYQLVSGLLDLHSAGIIHEDIKPSNILKKGKLYKYCDFGVSQLVTKLKHSQSRKGTVSYMPPEKLLFKFMPSAKSDIFSLGVTLYEVIFGFHPYLKQKTKGTREYLAALKKAQLRPSHQLLGRIHNPSLKFTQLIDIIEGMIARKPEMRVSIDELRDLLNYRQPFRSMRIPEQVEKWTTGEISNSNGYNDYSNLQPSPYLAQSNVFFAKSTLQQQENRLLNQSFKIQLQSSSQDYNTRRQEQLRLTKLLQEEQIKVQQLLFRQYHCIQAVITHLNFGIKYLSDVYPQVQTDPTCHNIYFKTEPFTQLQLNQQPICPILQFLVLKLNVQLMSKFCKSTENFENFYQQVQLWQDIEYLQAQVSKFLADTNNIRTVQVKKALISMCREFTVRDFCDILQRQFTTVFDTLVHANSVRINFKEDILNGLFLLHVNKLLHNLQQLNSIAQPQSVTQSSTSHLEALLLLQQTTTKFNSYKTYRMSVLKKRLYQQFSFLEGVIYDSEENTDEFIPLDDMISDDQQEREEDMGSLGDMSPKKLEKEVEEVYGNKNKDEGESAS